MHGIATLLDKDHYQLIEDLWAELERRFSVHGVYITPYPHFSYHVAQDYDLDLVDNIAVIFDSGTKQELKTRFDISNQPVPGESSMKRLHRRPVTRETLERIHQMREERTRQLMGEEEE